jgi:hypothetical protein
MYECVCVRVCGGGGAPRQYTVMRTTKPLVGGGGGWKNFDGIVNQAKNADLTKPNASHETLKLKPNGESFPSSPRGDRGSNLGGGGPQL